MNLAKMKGTSFLNEGLSYKKAQANQASVSLFGK
jgi:hypothetical protein